MRGHVEGAVAAFLWGVLFVLAGGGAWLTRWSVRQVFDGR